MSTLDHAELIQRINPSLGPFRVAQAEALQAWDTMA